MFPDRNDLEQSSVGQTIIQTIEELEAAVQEEWGSFELVLSFYNRFVMCKSYCRKNISPFFSGSKTEYPKSLSKASGLHRFSTVETTKLCLKDFTKKEDAGKEVTNKMGSPYTPISVKHRILLLTSCKRIEDRIEPGIENENPLKL